MKNTVTEYKGYTLTGSRQVKQRKGKITKTFNDNRDIKSLVKWVEHREEGLREASKAKSVMSGMMSVFDDSEETRREYQKKMDEIYY